MGLGYTYRGVTSKRLYVFAAPLYDLEGHPVVGGQFSTVFYSGPLAPAPEVLVYCNRDGSLAMPTAGPGQLVPSSQPGIGMISLPTVTPSPWEEA